MTNITSTVEVQTVSKPEVDPDASRAILLRAGRGIVVQQLGDAGWCDRPAAPPS